MSQEVQEEPYRPVYELGYWGGVRGQLHQIILLCEFLSVKYELKLYTSREDWFDLDKPLLSMLTPFPNLPYLKKGDLVVTESQAIIAFICYESGRYDLLGKEPFNTVQIIQIQGIHADLKKDLMTLLMNKQTYNEQKDKWLADKIHPKLSLLSKSLREGFLVGDISMVDFQLFETLCMMLKLYPDILNEHLQLKNYHLAFQNLPGIKEYLESDRCKQLTFMPKGYMAVDI